MGVRRALLALAGLLIAGTGCGSSAAADPLKVSEPFAALWSAVQPDTWRSTGIDTFQVFVCRVPAATSVPLYGGLPDRRTFTAADVVTALGNDVGDYFHSISSGAYRPEFEAGGDITMSATDTPERCARAAIAKAAPSARAVLLVADAEHAARQPGGLGSAGVPCPEGTSGGCPVAQSQRWAYVGAADFAPNRIARPPLDLIEHEIGHTLGWVHSGSAAATSAEGVYDSALDLMSNSAAPRATDPTRRDGPDTLAIDRLVAGWLRLDRVVAVTNEGDVRLTPSNSRTVDQNGEPITGHFVVLLPVDRSDFLTVEWLDNGGYNSHLPAGGVAVHSVSSKRGELYRVVPQFGAPPFDRLLQDGDRVVTRGWTIAVSKLADGSYQVHVRRQQ